MQVQEGVQEKLILGEVQDFGSSASPIALKSPDCHVREKQAEPLAGQELADTRAMIRAASDHFCACLVTQALVMGFNHGLLARAGSWPRSHGPTLHWDSCSPCRSPLFPYPRGQAWGQDGDQKRGPPGLSEPQKPEEPPTASVEPSRFHVRKLMPRASRQASRSQNQPLTPTAVCGLWAQAPSSSRREDIILKAWALGRTVGLAPKLCCRPAV